MPLPNQQQRAGSAARGQPPGAPPGIRFGTAAKAKSDKEIQYSNSCVVYSTGMKKMLTRSDGQDDGQDDALSVVVAKGGDLKSLRSLPLAELHAALRSLGSLSLPSKYTRNAHTHAHSTLSVTGAGLALLNFALPPLAAVDLPGSLGETR